MFTGLSTLPTRRTPPRLGCPWAAAVITPGLIFFFQAEDGIRDIGVTGVQTCALPIFVMWQFLLGHPEARLPPRSWPSGATRPATNLRESAAEFRPSPLPRRKSATSRWRQQRPAPFLLQRSRGMQ